MAGRAAHAPVLVEVAGERDAKAALARRLSDELPDATLAIFPAAMCWHTRARATWRRRSTSGPGTHGTARAASS